MTSKTPAFLRVRQEDKQEFEDSLDYIVRGFRSVWVIVLG